jgi:hypothetical protein
MSACTYGRPDWPSQLVRAVNELPPSDDDASRRAPPKYTTLAFVGLTTTVPLYQPCPLSSAPTADESFAEFVYFLLFTFSAVHVAPPFVDL